MGNWESGCEGATVCQRGPESAAHSPHGSFKCRFQGPECASGMQDFREALPRGDYRQFENHRP